jgi:DNA invertase Pin-like site-specific DNA recombinase
MDDAGHAVTLEDVVLVLRDYLRVSSDASGRMRSPAEQHEDNERDAASIGAVMGESYLEEGARSASRYGRKRRDAFHGLVADIASGTFAAEALRQGARAGLQLWELSRGSRKTGEWVALIDACEAAGILIRITTHRRTYDPRLGADRKTLLLGAVEAESSSAETSDRVLRALAADAAAGLPHGRIPYGFRREYELDARGRRHLIGQLPDAKTAPVVREVFLRIAQGHSLRTIAADLNKRKVPTVTGGPWSQVRVGGIARNPAYGGKRTHNGTLYDAQWEPLVRMDLYYAVQALMSSADRKHRPGREVHLLGYVAECGACGGPMSSRKHLRGQLEYWCIRRGCTWIQAGVLEQYVTGLLIARLSRPDVYDMLAGGGEDDPALQRARDKLAVLKARHADMAAGLAAGRLSVELAAAAEPPLLAELAAAGKAVQVLSLPPVIQRFMGGESDVAAAWASSTLAAKRELIRTYFARIAIRKRDTGGARIAMLTLTGTAPDVQPVTVRASSTFPCAGIIRTDGAWEAVARGRKEHLVAERTERAAGQREWAVIPLACDPLVVERTDYEWRQ